MSLSLSCALFTNWFIYSNKQKNCRCHFEINKTIHTNQWRQCGIWLFKKTTIKYQVANGCGGPTDDNATCLSIIISRKREKKKYLHKINRRSCVHSRQLGVVYQGLSRPQIFGKFIFRDMSDSNVCEKEIKKKKTITIVLFVFIFFSLRCASKAYLKGN